MPNIKITADSTCDIPAELCEKYDVEIKPLYTVLGDEAFRDGVDITPDGIYEYVDKNGNLPKTSAGSVDDYLTIFKKYADEGKEVVHISLGSALSSSYQNACIAASEAGNAHVVDSQSLSSGGALLIIKAYEMIEQGMSASDVAARLREDASKVSASFVVDRLDYLYKGGRCSSLEMLGANLLKIKPVIGVGEFGKMSMVDKPRGQYAKVLEKYVAGVLSKPGINKKRAFVTHTKCDSAVVAAVVEQVKGFGFEEVYDTLAGCVITSHCGPNTLGVIFEYEN